MNKFCLEPFKCLNVEKRDSKTFISSCCAMDPWKTNEIDFVNDEKLNQIRNKWSKNEWPEECNYCKKVESNNLVSRRQSNEQWFIDHKIFDTSIKLTKLDFWCGNLCNLRCAICGPENSLAWQKELGIKKKDRKIFASDAFKKLDLTELKWVHFNGGEPLLIDSHIDFLESLPNIDNIIINYNTNGTIIPKERLVKIWERAKLVQIDFSIDDINERFEYQRYPAKWNEVVNNLKWFYDNMPVNVMFGINIAISILNHHNIKNVEYWFNKNFNSNRVTDPVEIKKQLAKGNLALDAEKQTVLSYLNSLDLRRGTSWKEIFPELIDYFS